MFKGEKIRQINEKLEFGTNVRVAVWGMGKHTEELAKETELLCVNNLVFIDKDRKKRNRYGHSVFLPNEVDFGKIDVVIVSSLRYQEEIEKELTVCYQYSGKILKLYDETEYVEFYRLQSEEGIYYSGNYRSFEEAKRVCSGYAADNILEQVKKSTIEVIRGNAEYERDSVLFYQKEWLFHIVAMIYQAAQKKEEIVVADFGGALGSVYLQNREALLEISDRLSWYIVEQPEFVKTGKEIFHDGNLFFVDNICEIRKEISVFLFSGVLTYLDDYENVIMKALAKSPEYIIIDRTLIGNGERICVQNVPADIYQASYAARIFDRDRLLQMFSEEYDLIYEHPAYIGDIVYFGDYEAQYMFWILKRK